MSNTIKFTKGSIKFNKRDATVKIPLGLAKQLYEKAGGDCPVYLTVTNGILQCSPKVPDVIIPMIHLDKQYFVPHK